FASLAALVVFGSTAACSKGTDIPITPPAPSVKSVVINEPSQSIERGLHIQLTVKITSTNGDILQIPVTWRSTNEAIATVDLNGRVTTVDTGTVGIYAATQGLTGQVQSVPIGLHVQEVVSKIDRFAFAPLPSNAPGITPDSIRVQVFGPPGTVVGSRK